MQIIKVIEVLCMVANTRSVMFLSFLIVIKLINENEQKYSSRSMFDIIAKMSMNYHNDSLTFFKYMRLRDRERLTNPQLYLSNSLIDSAFQDETDYLLGLMRALLYHPPKLAVKRPNAKKMLFLAVTYYIYGAGHRRP
jgi:hypothetical protein